jgi:hypothetical protein
MITDCSPAGFYGAVAHRGDVRFACSGTIVLSQVTNLNDGEYLSIDAAGNDVTLSGGGSHPLFTVGLTANLALKGLVIQDTRSGYGGAIYSGGRVTISNSRFVGNQAIVGGGAIFNFGKLEVFDSTFENNAALGARGPGGAIWNTRSSDQIGSLSVSNVRFLGNTARQGGRRRHRQSIRLRGDFRVRVRS